MKRQVQGFSLIEVLIAIAILGVASLALLSFFSSANLYSSTGKSTQEADLVAQSVLEEVDSCKTLTDIDSQLMAATGSAWTLVKKENKQMTLSKKVTLNGSDYQARVLFDYDYDTNTLVVFNETGTVIDGTYVNGQKMDDTGKTDINEIVSETELESKVPDTLIDTKEADSASVSEDNSDLNRRIQSTILERYTDALITNYSASTLSGSFDSEGISYEFSWSDDLLEITEIENPNNVIYMKIAE